MTTKQARLIAAESYMALLRDNSSMDLYLSAADAGADSHQMADIYQMAESYYQTAHRVYVELKNRDVQHAVEDQMLETIRQLALKSNELVPTL